MNIIYEHLELLLRAAAVTQLAVAVLNLTLIRIMNWKPDLERMPLLIREVFHIHVQFISITLAIFGVLTWVCAGEITAAATPLAVGFAISVAIFWGIRSAMHGSITARSIGWETPAHCDPLGTVSRVRCALRSLPDCCGKDSA